MSGNNGGEVKAPLHEALSNLLLLVPSSVFESSSFYGIDSLKNPILYISQGKSSQLVYGSDYDQFLYSDNAKAILGNYPSSSLSDVLRKYVDHVAEEITQQLPHGLAHLEVVAIAFLQTFIQLNFTGPNVDYDHSVFFPGVDGSLVQLEALKLLALEGQVPYDLMLSPVLLIIASLILEKIMETPRQFSLVGPHTTVDVTECSKSTEEIVSKHQNELIYANGFWWRSRLLQVHLSLFSEPPSIISTLSTLLLTPAILTVFTSFPGAKLDLLQHLQTSYFLENARFSIHSQAESLATPLLASARKTSNLALVLTGARAKRTKFQRFHTANLIVLAKSQTQDYLASDSQEAPELHELDSDILLERPHFESLEDVELPDQPNTKRIKFDPVGFNDEDKQEKLLPIAFRQEDIPVVLKDIDPNVQPALNHLDNIQLLLRLTTLRQTTPSGNTMVEEELLALVSRILYVDSKDVNWAIFSRALWERSILETTKAKTIERGILQMTSLIEEIGLKIKTRLLPQAPEQDSTAVGSRLRFIHQLTLLPQWSMDMKLAEKYMSIGVFRSALDIYERLELACEAALCYAAVDREQEAESILVERINKHPEDARAISILGDIRQDPSLWERAWEVGKYHKAKASLSKYFYAPPQDSGLFKNLGLAIRHMNDSLQMNPLSYENWFFYGCCGLESEQYELAAEAFTRCVSLDDTNSHAWSNLATSLLRSDKPRPAFNALKKAIRAAKESKKAWKIYENYLIVAMQLHEWNDVLIATRELIRVKAEDNGENAIDIPVIERLVELLVSTEFPTKEGERLTHYQSSCIDLVCNMIPKVINTSSRCWKVVAKVELWRKRPWEALDCHEKAYRSISSSPDLDTNESIWNEAVEACSDLCAAYESLGDMPGKHDAGDVVCKDWKYKARQVIRSLMSKGKDWWEDSQGWYTLQDLKTEYSS